jgi:hypothetical protein
VSAAEDPVEPFRVWRLHHPGKNEVDVIQYVDDTETAEALDAFMKNCVQEGWTVTRIIPEEA